MIPTVGKWTHEKGEPPCRMTWIGWKHGLTRTLGSSARTNVRFLHLRKHFPGVQHRLGSNQMAGSSMEWHLGILVNKLSMSE